MMKLSISLLGPCSLTLNGESLLPMRTRKALALLCYLVTEQIVSPGTVPRRETLMTLLWPGMPERYARKSLRQALYLLRLSIPLDTEFQVNDDMDFILADYHSLQVNPHSHYELDIAAFLKLSTNGSHQAMADAVRLYRGDFLSDLYIRDSNDFEGWISTRRSMFREQMLKTLAALSRHYLLLHEYALAEMYARRQVEMEPFREEGQRYLIEALAQTGRHDLALATYTAFRKQLLRELGIEPDPLIQQMVKQIRSGRLHAQDGKVEVLRHTKPDKSFPPHQNLPSQPTSFVGRETELADIRRLLLDEPGCRLLSLIGPPGIGKTRLALAVALQLLDEFSDGTYFVSLMDLNEAKFIVQSIAETLKFTFHGNTDPKKQLLDFLQSKKLLLIIDNFEHLLAGSYLFSEILASAADITLLVTSRERLSLQEEWIYKVEGLDVPSAKVHGAMALAEYSSVTLFVQRARQNISDFKPTAVEMADIGRICRFMEGMPLGLELAASWTRTFSCREIAAEIENKLDFLTTPLQNVPERHRSIRVVFEQTWNRLSTAEQMVLARLSVFQGGFTEAAAEQVAGATLPQLTGLVDKSLVSSPAPGKYELHKLLQQFASEKLMFTADEPERTVNRFCHYYATLMRNYEMEHRRNLATMGGRVLDTLSDWHNVHAAWRRALSYRLIADIGQFVYFFTIIYEIRGLLQDAEEELGLALAQLRISTGSVDSAVLQRVLTHYAWFSLTLSKFEQAGSSLEEALALSTALEGKADACDTGLTIYFLAWMNRLQGQPTRAKALLQESVERYQSVNYQMGLWMCMALRGDIEYETGNYEIACQYYEQGLGLCEDTQFVIGTVYLLMAMGIVHSVLRQYTRAADYLRRGLILNRDLMQNAPIFTALLGIAALVGRQGQCELALELSLIIINHPQCSVVARYQTLKLIGELSASLSKDEIDIVDHNVRTGQFSNRFIDRNFSVSTQLVDRLLEVLDQAT